MTHFPENRQLRRKLERILPAQQILTRPIDRLRYARDASFYRLIPQAVVQPRTEAQIVSLINLAIAEQLPLTFRAAGTSLSGQGITDGILVEITDAWQGYRLGPGNDTIHLQPGIIGARANAILAPLGRKIGPDPASISACRIGGIIANNASGMCCGVQDNSYHTLQSIRAILPDGYVLDTSVEGADDKLTRDRPQLAEGLLGLRRRLLAEPDLAARIREKYQRKNTLGYSLNAFLDYERPAEILAHLLVGSEGTLGFVAEVELRTLPDLPYKSAALLLFPSIRHVCEAVPALAQTGAAALELMDRASLRSIETEAGMPDELRALGPDAAALLVEFQAATQLELQTALDRGRHVLGDFSLLVSPRFSMDETTRMQYWKVRKGLLPSVGAVRQSGTTVIIEDICFRLEDLAEATLELQALFRKHGYEDAIIFGHARDGNLHFVISQAFNTPRGLQQYADFMQDVVALTVGRFDGALKAEHGTGRNMAPFVETEWGTEALAIMEELKTLLDPANILNPGVIVHSTSDAHLQHIKPTPTVEEEVDRCIECGFCEHLCPSRQVTMTPRQRIATWRELEVLRVGDSADRYLARQIQGDFDWLGTDTCAVDGLCALGCPVHIDTGDLTRRLRAHTHGRWARRIAAWTVEHFATVVRAVRLGLRLLRPVSRLPGWGLVIRGLHWLHAASNHRFPVLSPRMPTGGRGVPHVPATSDPTGRVVVFLSCLHRGMGELPGEVHPRSTPEALLEVLAAAGWQSVFPKELEALCCGTPYSSKGYTDAFQDMATKTVEALYEASSQGSLPILVDTSPCTYKMLQYDRILSGTVLEHWRSLRILDVIEFLHGKVLPTLELNIVPGKAVLHPTCSTRKMGLEGMMLELAGACADTAVIPESVSCCGFAGDRGFLQPELTASATREEALEVNSLGVANGYYSTSRTCEIGMSDATEESYSSLIHLIWRAVFEEAGAIPP